MSIGVKSRTGHPTRRSAAYGEYSISTRSVRMVSKMLSTLGGDDLNGYKNRKSRHRHDPSHPLGGSHHRYRDDFNCHWGRHLRIASHPPLNRLSSFEVRLFPATLSSFPDLGLTSLSSSRSRRKQCTYEKTSAEPR